MHFMFPDIPQPRRFCFTDHSDDRTGDSFAIGTFYAFGRIGLNNTIGGLVLAHTLLSPLVMIIITAAFRTYDMNQERVARV